MTAPRPIRSNWCIGMTERPSTTEISTFTLLREDMEFRRKDCGDDPWPIMLSTPLMTDAIPLEWKISPAPVPYPDAVRLMEERVEAIHRHAAKEMVWLLEHPPLYTAGTSAKDADLLDPRFPVFKSGR